MEKPDKAQQQEQLCWAGRG